MKSLNSWNRDSQPLSVLAVPVVSGLGGGLRVCRTCSTEVLSRALASVLGVPKNQGSPPPQTCTHTRPPLLLLFEYCRSSPQSLARSRHPGRWQSLSCFSPSRRRSATRSRLHACSHKSHVPRKETLLVDPLGCKYYVPGSSLCGQANAHAGIARPRKYVT